MELPEAQVSDNKLYNKQAKVSCKGFWLCRLPLSVDDHFQQRLLTRHSAAVVQVPDDQVVVGQKEKYDSTEPRLIAFASFLFFPLISVT